jgi:hypothetical protein
MIFEIIPQNDGFFLLKTPDGGCVSYTKNGGLFESSAGEAYALSYCKPNNNNLWKNSLGQIFNKDGRALWWKGDKSITFFFFSIQVK